MVILRQATIRFKGYDPNSLTKGSHKRICYSCDKCGRVGYVEFRYYKDLCSSCSVKGQNNPFYGKCHSDESKKLMRDSSRGKNNGMYEVHKFGKESSNWQGGKVTLTCKRCGNDFKVYPSLKNIRSCCSQKCYSNWQSENLVGENSYNWLGGISGIRDYVLPKSQCVNLNQHFKGSNFHHIMSGVGIYIPEYLHKNIRHNFKSGQGMDEMSVLAFQFIKGEL